MSNILDEDYLAWHHAIVPRATIPKLANSNPELYEFLMAHECNCMLVHEHRLCHRHAFTRREALVMQWHFYRTKLGGVEPIQTFVAKARMMGFDFGFNVDIPSESEISWALHTAKIRTQQMGNTEFA